MSAPTRRLRRREAKELVELLGLVADLCVGAYSTISLELRHHVEGCDAGDLRADALRLAERVAVASELTPSSPRVRR
jgi:hypothetical protein